MLGIQRTDMTNASAWFALAGALGGIALTGTFSLTTAVLNNRWAERTGQRTLREQHVKETADRLRAVFHDYLVATNAYYHAVHQVHIAALRGDKFDRWEDVRDEYRTLQEEYQYLTILAGDQVRMLARAYDVALYDLADAAKDGDNKRWSKLEPETHKARDRVRIAMRAELGTPD